MLFFCFFPLWFIVVSLICLHFLWYIVVCNVLVCFIFLFDNLPTRIYTIYSAPWCIYINIHLFRPYLARLPISPHLTQTRIWYKCDTQKGHQLIAERLINDRRKITTRNINYTDWYWCTSSELRGVEKAAAAGRWWRCGLHRKRIMISCKLSITSCGDTWVMLEIISRENWVGELYVVVWMCVCLYVYGCMYCVCDCLCVRVCLCLCLCKCVGLLACLSVCGLCLFVCIHVYLDACIFTVYILLIITTRCGYTKR